MHPVRVPSADELANDRGVNWREAAECREADTAVFFPDTNHRSETVQAKALCGGCVVRALCLNEALSSNQRHGVWGGMTPSERDAYQQSLSLGKERASHGRAL